MKRFVATLATLAAVNVFAFSGSTVQAAFTIDATVGGAPTGVNYVNFNNLNLGNAGGVSGGVTVSFSGEGQAVQGSSASTYAAPIISNSNGALFGDPTVSGADTTTYLTTGIGSVTLNLPGSQRYLGLLWGSVDTYNSLQFYDSSNTLLGTITGSMVTASANGNQGAAGTFYVNINSDIAFSRVVATSTSRAFEFDNVAFNATPVSVPEPSSMILLGSGLAAASLTLARRRRSATVAGR